MCESRLMHFAHGVLITLTEAEHTDHSDSDEHEGDPNSSSPTSINGGLQSSHPLLLSSREVQNDSMISMVSNNGDHHRRSWESKNNSDVLTRVTFSPDPSGTRETVHADVCGLSTEVERGSSKSQLTSTPEGYDDVTRENGGVVLTGRCHFHTSDSNGSRNSDSRRRNANSNSIEMDDDSSGLRFTAASPAHSQKEPEGTMPFHRIGESRRFSGDLGDIVQQQLEEEDINGGTVSTFNGDSTRSPPSSPPEGLKEISISKVVEDDDDSDSVSAPTASLPVDDMPPPSAPIKAASDRDFAQETLETSRHYPIEHANQPQQHQQQEQEESWRPRMNGSFDGHSASNLPYTNDSPARPPSNTDQAPQESDLSVFSIHSGYAVHDPSGAFPPRIVPGAIVQGPASYPHHYANLPPQVSHQTQLPTMQTQHSNGYAQHYAMQHTYAPAPAMPPQVIMGPPSVGKRKVHFRLIEDAPPPAAHKGKRASFLSFRRSSSWNMLNSPHTVEEPPREIERGRVTVSWYEGTTTLELVEHVRNSVIRKLGLQGSTKLAELRILDEGANPTEEIVLSPYIPNESRLLLRFTTRDADDDGMTPYARHTSYAGGAPDSPSAAPSPHASALDLDGLGLNANQLALLGARLKGLQMPQVDTASGSSHKNSASSNPSKKSSRLKLEPRRAKSDRVAAEPKTEPPKEDMQAREDDSKDSKDDQSSVFEMQSLHPEDQIQKSLQNVTDLLMMERQKFQYNPKQQKRQVIFVLANYFVLFLSLIAISAEIQARAPEWNATIERHLNSVKNCSKDQDALFECVSNGDFSGLVASVVLWISRSAATKRIFLFGFDSPRKLWTAVYESLVTAVCWGFSYMFIRRGMNPDTNRNFLQKYWKDAVYGSLAGFNAAFMKHVLKNLLPQEAIEDALQDRQLKILSWLPSFR